MTTPAARRWPGLLRVASALLAAAVLWAAGPLALAADPEWVVLEAVDAAWEPGALIAPDADLDLVPGASLVVVSGSGETRALRGPYRGSLRRALEQAQAPQTSRSWAIGATRGAPNVSIPRVEARPPIQVGMARSAGSAAALLEPVPGLPHVHTASEAEPADVEVRLDRENVWLEAPASQEEARLRERVPRVGTELQQRVLLGHRLAVMARANRLLQVASFAGRPPTDLRVTLARERAGRRQPAELGAVVRVQHGDVLELTLDNRGREPVDLNVFWIDARGRIECLFPSDPLEANRLQAGAAERVVGRIDARETRGHEYLVVLGVRGQPQDAALVLAGIADASWSDAGSPEPSPATGSPGQVLETARWQLEARAACAACSLFATAYALEIALESSAGSEH